jgi:hypothetical protein
MFQIFRPLCKANALGLHGWPILLQNGMINLEKPTALIRIQCNHVKEVHGAMKLVYHTHSTDGSKKSRTTAGPGALLTSTRKQEGMSKYNKYM